MRHYFSPKMLPRINIKNAVLLEDLLQIASISHQGEGLQSNRSQESPPLLLNSFEFRPIIFHPYFGWITLTPVWRFMCVIFTCLIGFSLFWPWAREGLMDDFYAFLSSTPTATLIILCMSLVVAGSLTKMDWRQARNGIIFQYKTFYIILHLLGLAVFHIINSSGSYTHIYKIRT